MGNEALALGALRAGVSVVAGYPGTPSTEILETILREIQTRNWGDRVYAEWSVNEKTALELAAGAACAGARALVTMKQVGLNVASDPLMSLNYLGVAGALVVAAADDPGPLSSQTEQDTRRFGIFAKLAVFDPATPEEAYLMIADAFACSEKYGRPVIFRPTTRVCHSYAGVEILEDLPRKTPAGFDKAGGRWVIFPSLTYRSHLQIEKDLELLAEDPSAPGSRLSGAGTLGIAAGGVSWTYVQEITGNGSPPCKLFKVGSYPIPKALALDFLRGLREVLVVEELDPVIEEELLLLCGAYQLPVRIRGKRSGCMPRAGENTLGLLEPKIREFLGLPPRKTPDARPLPPPPPLPARPPVLCAGCPHRGSFIAVKEAAREYRSRPGMAGGMNGGTDVLKTVYAGDIGCYTLGNAPPLDMVDACLCMGAGITMAQGINRIEPETLTFAFIGDSTFFHTGIPGVINGVYNRANSIIVVLNNSATAMTGNQTHPGIGKTALGEATAKVRIPAILAAIGVREIRRVNPLIFPEAKQAVLELLPLRGVRALVFESPCIALTPSHGQKPRKIAPDKCSGCQVCIKTLGCPAIVLDTQAGPEAGGKPGGLRAAIDEALCTGCGLCGFFCAFDAIEAQTAVPAAGPAGEAEG
ncbi:MAG: indolepyruvate ferredoxin oxidoreductase subunit alpha [Treponema sp.]|nr:indolepyruvate ferredoxin oxidoreductase subunit alpha [Treponema sp.]